MMSESEYYYTSTSNSSSSSREGSPVPNSGFNAFEKERSSRLILCESIPKSEERKLLIKKVAEKASPKLLGSRAICSVEKSKTEDQNDLLSLSTPKVDKILVNPSYSSDNYDYSDLQHDPSHKTKRQKTCTLEHQEDSMDEIGFDCPICLTGFINRTYLENCYHQFCFVCISSYIGTCFPNTLCPLCKQHFDKVYYNCGVTQNQSPVKETLLKSKEIQRLSFCNSIIKVESTQNFKVATCLELYDTPVVKAVGSLKELCLELNSREKKTPRDRQLIFEYSLSACYSKSTSKRFLQELKRTPFGALDPVNFSCLLYDHEVGNDTELLSFLKRDITAILLIIHPLHSESLLSLTIKQTLSTLTYSSNKTLDNTFESIWRSLDEYISPFSEPFLKEVVGFIMSPFYTSANAVQLYDKWIKYNEV